MIDRLKFSPDRVFLNDDAIHKDVTVDGFTRVHKRQGKEQRATIVIKWGSERSLVSVVASRLGDGRWWVSKIDINVPGLLYGHNARPIRTQPELWQALTNLKVVLSLILKPDCVSRAIPGVGADNQGFISYVELMVQIQDPEHRLLTASHLARLKSQQRATMVCFNESTRCSTREIAVSIYDKWAQVGEGHVIPDGVDSTRIEAIIKNELRLGKELREPRSKHRLGQVVSTLTLADGYDVMHRNLERLTGFRWLQDQDKVSNLSKCSRLIVAFLGDEIALPHRLNWALEAYRLRENPSASSWRTVEKEVRAFAFNATAPDARELIPENPDDLQWSEIQRPNVEGEFAVLLRDLGVPSEPDPAIVEAWSTTRFLEKPLPEERIGTVMPSAPPFLQKQL